MLKVIDSPHGIWLNGPGKGKWHILICLSKSTFAKDKSNEDSGASLAGEI
jgi:hypothetical protein